MADMIAIILAYLVTIFLISGGLICLYVSLRMISKRAQASGSATSFKIEAGDYKISIGTGSLAALVLTISVLWALVALLSRPTIEFAANGEQSPGALKLISDITVKPDTENIDDVVFAKLVNKMSSMQADRLSDLVSTDAAHAAADSAAAAADSAADAAAAAADAAADSADAAADSADAADDAASSGE